MSGVRVSVVYRSFASAATWPTTVLKYTVVPCKSAKTGCGWFANLVELNAIVVLLVFTACQDCVLTTLCNLTDCCCLPAWLLRFYCFHVYCLL